MTSQILKRHEALRSVLPDLDKCPIDIIIPQYGRSSSISEDPGGVIESLRGPLLETLGNRLDLSLSYYTEASGLLKPQKIHTENR